ncbi:MAG: hypothetical protein EOP06_04265, partial [Proteobacteria bacterium]
MAIATIPFFPNETLKSPDCVQDLTFEKTFAQPLLNAWHSYLKTKNQMNDQEQKTIIPLAGKPPIVEQFTISGLFGYRTISLNSKSAATVVIAANGSGKTTLLGALDAFLKGQFLRLADLEFSSIHCKLKGNEEFIIEKSDIDRINKIPTRAQFSEWAKYWDIEPYALVEFLVNDYPLIGKSNTPSNPIFDGFVVKAAYDRKKVISQCESLVAVLEKSPKLENIKDKVRKLLADIEVIYLPTYRRIELSLSDSTETERILRKKPSIQARLGLSKMGLHPGDIQFGLADISERLGILHRQILGESNRGYGQISANIVNDLISGTFAREIPKLEERPSKEALHLFFSRIDQEDERGHYYTRRTQLPNIERIYAADDVDRRHDDHPDRDVPV